MFQHELMLLPPPITDHDSNPGTALQLASRYVAAAAVTRFDSLKLTDVHNSYFNFRLNNIIHILTDSDRLLIVKTSLVIIIDLTHFVRSFNNYHQLGLNLQ